MGSVRLMTLMMVVVVVLSRWIELIGLRFGFGKK
jgi:hypothetical protein